MGKKSESAYLKQCRKGKLKIWIRLYLHCRGKHDAKKNIIRIDENGIYSSPYIYQEIQTYMLALQTKKASFCTSTVSAKNGIDVFQLQIQQKQFAVTSKEQTSGIVDYKKDCVEQTVAVLEIKKQELLSYITAEEELDSLHSEQLIYVLKTKIATYWNGVLHGCGDHPQMPPIVAVDHLINQ